MARLIPSDFDVFKEELDLCEIFVRDSLKVNIENWAKFRFSIHTGNNSDVLLSSNPIDNEVKQAFIELAKSHYEVVNSIGYSKLCLTEIQSLNELTIDYQFRVNKGMKEFYIHLGSVFDNLARLIFILNSADSATRTRGKNKKLVRHWIDWSQLVKEFNFNNYNFIINNPMLTEILNLRNNFIHNWRAIIYVNPNNKGLYLSKQIRDDRNYLWHYEEKADFDNKYTDYKPLVNFLSDDFSFVEESQNNIFKQLIVDLSVFETNYNLKIKE